MSRPSPGGRAMSRLCGARCWRRSWLLPGFLSGFAPAAYVPAQATAAAAQHVVVVGSNFATTVRVRLTVTPGTVGPNEFQARVTDYDPGRPAPATAVRLQFSLPSRPDLG